MTSRYRSRAYPRTCGGAVTTTVKIAPDPGLSPHLRGSLLDRDCRDERARPIPAPAGEPTPLRRGLGLLEAYPRTCGGAIAQRGHGPHAAGLSPHLRGSPHLTAEALTALGPIPAPAGEPCHCHVEGSLYWAYPRTCGGARSAQFLVHRDEGLSPHLRGSLGAEIDRGQPRGPIPAPAGEPWPRARRSPASRAYPRTCGGAAVSSKTTPPEKGLSPHLRGSRTRSAAARPSAGPIPAPAGEPRCRRPDRRR